MISKAFSAREFLKLQRATLKYQLVVKQADDDNYERHHPGDDCLVLLALRSLCSELTFTESSGTQYGTEYILYT